MAKTRMMKPGRKSERWKVEDLNPKLGRHNLYRLFDADMNLLYVGISGTPFERWRAHARLKPWWSEVEFIYSIETPSKRRAEELELEAIKQDRPRYNLNGAVS